MVNIPEAFATAVAHHQAGRLSEATAIYRQILAVDPDNVPTLNNLGIIVSPAEAILLLVRAVTIKPDHLDSLINLGNSFKAEGKLDDAIAWYERAVAVAPDFPRALFNLANTLQARGRLDDAITWYEKAVAAKPDYLDALIQLANSLQAQGKLDAALAMFERAQAIDPEHPYILLGAGTILQAQGNLDGAIARYERAVAIKPDFAAALHNLGSAHDGAGRPAVAAKWFRWALTLDPTLTDANIGMVKILEGEGRLAEAAVFRSHVPRPHPIVVETAPEQRRAILIPSVVGPGNVPLHSLLSPRTTTRLPWYIDYTTDEQEANLPPHDFVFNGVGNADLIEPSFARLTRLHERRPMLNPPDTVARTRRDRLPDLLAGIPDVVVPRVVRLRRDQVLEAGLAAKLAAAGIGFPVLVRPLATHSGMGMVPIETPQQLAEMALGDSDAYYFIAFHDSRSTDGYYRKYRTIFVDRKPYPYHLAISEHWLVHYFSANMLDGPMKREEEHRFLADPAAVMGPKATAAIAAIGRRMDMDFAGIDFALLPDGRVLVFEANANMSVYLPESGDDFPYKQIYVPIIIKAFDAMLEQHEKKLKLRT